MTMVLLLIGVLSLRRFMWAGVSPEQRAIIQSAEQNVIRLEPEWHQPAKLPSMEVVRFQEKFATDMARISREHSSLINGVQDDMASQSLLGSIGYAVPPMNEEQIYKMLADLQKVIDEVTSVTARHDYVMESDLVETNYDSLEVFAKLMRVKSLLEARGGNWNAAVESVMLPMKVVKRKPQSSTRGHRTGADVTEIVSAGMKDIADICSDTASLRHGLELMDAHREIARVALGHPLEPGELLTALRYAAAYNAPVDLSPRPLAIYYRQVAWLNGEKYQNWLINNLPAGHPRILMAKKQLNTIRSDSPPRGVYSWLARLQKQNNPQRYSILNRLVNGLVGADSLVILHVKFGGSNYQGEESRVETAAVLYDLARLRLAQRLAQLEGKWPEAVMNETTTESTLAWRDQSIEAVGAYVNPVPEDGFTSGPMKVSAGGKFYSIGPDKVDDDGAVLYDATNGAVSRGDVGFREKFR